ncbi:hypothetical protein J3R82DRAFT_11433 [Butyriboletus roseoflavus]|nr:hypothetical protein J3R82DRAFT_11433 [Butyriboletus roseoflavus]
MKPISVPSPRPPKRIRVSPSPHPLPPSSYPPPPQVKCERSPSPHFTERRVVTSGTKHFAPIPNDCLPSCTEYTQNRSEWVARCAKELEALNLIPERKLIRKSHVPVWSDTLKPDPLDLAATIMLAHRSNAQWHRPPIRKASPQQSVTTTSTRARPSSSPPIFGNVPDAEPPSKKKLLVPPRSLSKRRNNSSQLIPTNSPLSGLRSSSPCSERPRFPDERETASHSPLRDPVSSLADPIPIPSDIPPRHGRLAVPREPPSSVRDQPIAPCTSPAAEEVMSEMTLNYLRRYVQIYEADRASLASAYATNASFAYRVHRIVQNISGGASSIWAASPQCFSSGPKRTRLDIVTTLLTLPCLHLNGQNSTIAQIEYDIFYLGAELGMFVICRMVMSTKTVVHSFILQRKEVDVEDAVIRGCLAPDSHCPPNPRLRSLSLHHVLYGDQY